MAVSDFDYAAALQACARNDQSAFRNLYQHEAPRILALALRMLGERSSAEDLLRDVFILIWKNAAGYDPATGPARAWIYSIVRYRALGRLRQPGQVRAAASGWMDQLPDGDRLGASADGFLRALAGLDATQRRALMLAYYHGCTYDQMEARLNAPADDIRQALRAGLDTLRERQYA
ncbi:sigma-70 family RNA polymerase sigma factor [Parapusillimonas granuli]|uniref:Sigma-70 family RNA polymerase sigma factor n=1 Tax=Parapusillimonas granuli TaxID=380911 RepID=A0A853G9M6_9BURK|nr:sigma-70 family RNA polymerase sigma factor [Parapusillimonas granuli]MBB5214332.1 RNA polymerase sigma-70 factor (ECF subfamily) [Parapusillimonas granuli]MEB2399145.1 sigma-70 family RNA polymerase sigma factor [Alcaligenaceae bacterium]NYT51436.1 sigma-70 family RNA polymerase sigma factor [Parapusillimonas granuli]